MPIQKTVMLTTLLLVILPGCGRMSGRSTDAWTPQDSWYRAPENDLLWKLYDSPLDRAQFAPVHESSRAAAEELLRDDPFLKIDAEKANELVGSEVGLEGDGEYYLLRGLYLQEGTGSFTVHARGGQVLVYHGCLGRSPVPMNRTAVVARLSEPPTDVYTMCSMDE
jgi:hypothetical protein